jgi:hypothetical protein
MSTPALNPLVEKIRGKYPGAYDDMDDAALTKAILAKYPQYSDLAAPPVAKPSVKMDTGEGPIAAGMTSFETQLSKVPAATGQFLKSAARGFPEDTAEHAKVMAGHQGAVEELKNALQKVNPFVTNSEGIDYGATAANLLPVLLGMKKGNLKGSLDESASALKSGAESVLQHPVTQAVAKTVDAATFNRISKVWDAWKNLPEEIRARGPQFKDSGGPLPEAPPQELLQARALSGQAAPEQGAALGKIPVKDLVGKAGNIADSIAQNGPTPANVKNSPPTLSGESALRQVLTGMDNGSLLKIARARGLNVTKEAQLKPGIADGLLINKIIDGMEPEQLQEIGAQYLENSRFRHKFGDISPEAWRTMSLQTYFPDLKIPAASLARLAKATSGSPVSPQSLPQTEDLTSILQESVKRARQAKSQ